MIFDFGNLIYDFSKKTYIMGILNITPDSFSDGGKYFEAKLNLAKVVEDAVQMEKDGADFIDVGGESTRPGSENISIGEELDRVIPVISELKSKISLPVSIDTYKSEVAEEALKAGASIVNDISGFRFDDKLPAVTAKYNASCILMHIKGTPKDMQKDPVYNDVVKEVYNYLQDSISIAKKYGIEQIVTDPGIGFGKTLEHNIELIRNLSEFRKLGYPVLIGVSRKSFIDKIQKTPVDERLEATIAANTIGIINGANIIRVHDVKENQKASILTDKIFYT
ncbi:MAG: dihydropteroate synthase [Ignavibacteria bacterium]|nr:dihydropteroate synthase [Ignavibacteria bacterium]